MKKESPTADVNLEIKKALEGKKLIIGRNRVVKGIKNGTIKSVIKASNCPMILSRDIDMYSRSGDFELKGFPGNSLRLGQICGKPFNIVLLGIKK